MQGRIKILIREFRIRHSTVGGGIDWSMGSNGGEKSVSLFIIEVTVVFHHVAMGKF